MPIGVILNALAVVAGGFIGTLIGPKLKSDFKQKITLALGCCTFGMGISMIFQMQNIAVVVLAVVVGSIIGLALHLGVLIDAAGGKMQKLISRVVKNSNPDMTEKEFLDTLTTIIVLFCSTGTGIYGSIISGMTGDHSMLIAKSILDLATATIFASSMGLVVSLVAIPQFVVFILLFLFAGVIYPHCTDVMIGDFKACSGFLMLAIGFRICKIKMFPTADMLPALVFVMPLSWLWVTYIMPLLA